VRGSREKPIAEEGAEVSYRSLAFPGVLARMRSVPKPVVLDLGPALGSNLHALEHLGPRIYIADILSMADEELPLERAHAKSTGKQFWRWLFRNRPHERLDVILAWDLLNYLTLDEIRILIEDLQPHVVPGTLLFAVIAQGKEIPRTPPPYAIRSGSILVPQGQSPGQAPAPRYREPELRRALPGFVVDASYLLRSGLQEYLFAYRPEEEAPASEALEPASAGD